MAWPTEASSGDDDFLNYFGATIFWLYIAAALYFSVIVILSIYNVPTPGVKKSSLQQRVMKDVAHFSALAGASFGALSVNMLNILYQSYLAWSGRHRLRASLSVSQIWRWSITSTLFQDFGEAIVQHPVRYFWTHSALVTTLAVSFFIGTAGRQHHIRRLSAFFCLGQILPISFTQNLFYAALLKAPSTAARSARPKMSFRSFICVMLTYYVCLIIAPRAAGTSWLLVVIVIARLCLFSPLYIIKMPDANRPGADQSWHFMLDAENALDYIRIASFTSTALIVYKMTDFEGPKKTLQSALGEHPAVATLGIDFMLSGVSYILWRYRGRHTKDLLEQAVAEEKDKSETIPPAT